jgi:acylphosphatase
VTARRFLIAGRVQGVGFRWFVARLARELGLRGAARNLPDGRVDVTAAGNAAELGQLETALRSGPPGARVDRLEVHEVEDETSVPKGFSIS